MAEIAEERDAGGRAAVLALGVHCPAAGVQTGASVSSDRKRKGVVQPVVRALPKYPAGTPRINGQQAASSARKGRRSHVARPALVRHRLHLPRDARDRLLVPLIFDRVKIALREMLVCQALGETEPCKAFFKRREA